MRNVDTHLLGEKIEEAVSHFINSHPTGEVDASSLALNVQDENGRVLTVMHVDQHGYSPQVCRQVTVGEQVNTQWTDEAELMDTDARLAAIVAHLHQTRPSITSHHKVPSSRSEVEGTVTLDAPMRLFNGSTLEQQTDTVLEVALPPLPSLQNMKRCSDGDWYSKAKGNIKNEPALITDSEALELASSSPAPHKQNKKSLPHKKRISRKLKRNPGNTTPQQVEDIVVITNCNENEVPQEEILPDNFPHQSSLHSITHEVQVRPIFICQLCGDFYGEEQLKFYQHLKQHYEPHSTIIIENPVSDLGIDKMTNTCVVDNSAALPDAIVELSLENTVPKTIYQTIDKHILYTSSEKTLNFSSNKLQYSMATMEKDSVVQSEVDKSDLYDSLDKLEMYSCGKCNRTFRKQKQCEQHIKDVHGSKLDDMSEFSDTEDLMEGIHVSVSEAEQHLSSGHYEHSLLPHLTVENGHVHQSQPGHWYVTRSSSNSLQCGDDVSYCPVCPTSRDNPHSPHQLKEEVLHRIFETEVTTDPSGFPDAVIETNIPPRPPPPPSPPAPGPGEGEEPGQGEVQGQGGRGKGGKQFVCGSCGRVFKHRNSLFYHMLSHEGKQKVCKECGKSFYTTGALKVHKRVHNGDRPYKCDLCEKDFKQITDLKYHKLSIHSDQKNHKCEYCGKEFARKYSLTIHRKIHTGERNYKCDYCNKTFRASSYKNCHMRSHTGDKPYKCAECGKGFRVGSDLRRHQRTHEKLKNNPDTKPSEKLMNEIKQEKQKMDTATENKTIQPKTKQTQPKNNAAKTQNKTAKDKKPSKATKKNQIKKGAAPNVTVTNKLPNDPQFKMADYDNPIEFESKIQYKIKEIYDSETQYKNKQFNEPALVNLKDIERITDDREILRTYKDTDKRENTDGKLQVFTHVKPTSGSQVTLNDLRTFDRDVTREVRTELGQGDAIENGFFAKLSALYNIPAV